MASMAQSLPFMDALIKALMPQSAQDSRLLGGPPTFLMGGPQGPVYPPQGGGPQPAQKPGRMASLGRALTGPAGMAGMTTAGLSLLQPNWQGPKAAISNAIAQAMQAIYYQDALKRQRGTEAATQEREERKVTVAERGVAVEEAGQKSLAEYRTKQLEAEEAAGKRTAAHQAQVLDLETKRLDAARTEASYMQKRYELELDNEKARIAAGIATAADREQTRQMAIELHKAQLKVQDLALRVELTKLKKEAAEDPDIKLLERAVEMSGKIAAYPPPQAYASLTDTASILALAAKGARDRVAALGRTVESFASKMPPDKATAFREKAAPLLKVQPAAPKTGTPAEGAEVEGPAMDRTTRLPIASAAPTAPATAPPAPVVAPTAAPAPQTTAPARGAWVGKPSNRPEGTPGRDPQTGETYVVRGGKWQLSQ